MVIDRRSFLQSLGLGILASSGLGGRWFRQGSGVLIPMPAVYLSAAVRVGDALWEWREIPITQAQLDDLGPLLPDGTRQFDCFRIAEVLVPEHPREGPIPPDRSYDDLILSRLPAGPYRMDPMLSPRGPHDPKGLLPERKIEPGAGVVVTGLGNEERLEGFRVKVAKPEDDPGGEVKWGDVWSDVEDPPSAGLIYSEGFESAPIGLWEGSGRLPSPWNKLTEAQFVEGSQGEAILGARLRMRRKMGTGRWSPSFARVFDPRRLP